MRRDFPQKLPVPLCQLPRAVETDEITVKSLSFNHDASLAPLSGRVAVLVLDLDLVTRLERRELPSSSGQLFLHGIFPHTVGLCSGVCSLSPLLSGEEFSRLEWQGVTENSPVHDLGWGEAGDGTRSVSVSQESLEQSIGVQGASLGNITADHSLGVFDC